jgi:hypothetical protein
MRINYCDLVIIWKLYYIFEGASAYYLNYLKSNRKLMQYLNNFNNFILNKINKINIMWYIIIILTLVYWALYKILKEFFWDIFNKQATFLLSFYKKLKQLHKNEN